MNPYCNIPPGCHPDDTGTSDTYECSHCGQGFEQSELDPDQDEPMCKGCSEDMREQTREEDAEVRAQQPTPGPWHCNLGNGSNLSNDPCIWADNVVVAVAGGPDDPSYSPAVVANARLIAAAPALLEACQAFGKAICSTAHPVEQQRMLQQAWLMAGHAVALVSQGGVQ